MIKIRPFGIILLLGLCLSCNGSDDNPLNCDNALIISSFQYSNAQSAVIEINTIEIDGDVLTVQISSGGCNGETWNLCLIDSEAILESFPPQRHLRFTLQNNESCLAYLSRTFSYDISALQTEGNSVVLHIDDYEDSLLYSY
ncbi:MAG: hypothetical protein HKN00_06935 [Flavobacteriaceae bacterium]|nr:hypothetical protein [Bacteroidia bacterium]MBT8286781.1 hypothetical protein [Bacteroidia bacterium]NNF74900.1 hypothetical protein [Flavobacteriaceae bacterium]NNK72705.1 hypothetical protein [Flavobacteriaceae bacterium]